MKELKLFHDSDQYDIIVPRERHIGLEFHGMDTVLPFLVKRNWALLTTTDSQGPFVTTDHPVVLTWKKPEEIPPLMRQSPGFGMTDTEILFPLTKNALLVGDFEGKEGTILASLSLVAAANTKMIMHAFDQAYGPKQTFPYLGPDGQIYYDRMLFERFGTQPGAPGDGLRPADL